MHQIADRFSLTGKVALVTGGSSGIGQAIAVSLAQAGAATVLVARREAQLRESVAALRDEACQAQWLSADLTDLAALPATAARAAEPFGDPDIVVNAAGVNLREAAEHVTLESWHATLTINLSTPFFLARALVPAMQRRGWGRVINIASLQSRRAFANSIAYGASKGGVDQLTRAMAQAWSAHGVNCNAIAPGFFPTDLTAPVFEDPERAEQMAAQTAIGRNGELHDLAGAAIFLASPASDYITGQTLYVDGGFTAK